ncbi:MAG: DNA-binding protein [Chloroflexi bacterium]|nr:DNA-binding protein [Chloroflexota bacterium]MDL1942078.1 Zn-ribbon domain-containing OB-fold protein [Chloroflexi bacterium CFX2]
MTLLERDKHAPAAWHGNLPVTSRYTYGIAGEKFFRALKDEGRIMGTVCPNCGLTYVPAAAFCERCLSELTEWVDVGLVGELHTFTILFVDYEGNPLDEPELVGFVKFGDGGIVHKLEAEPDTLAIGMKMEAALKPKSKRTGSILDIEHFKPIKT